MIKSFRCKETEKLAKRERSKRFASIERVAQRKLAMLAATTNLQDLARVGLEKLRRDRLGQYSIRVNDQWRVCFVWKDGNAHEVEIVDYH